MPYRVEYFPNPVVYEWQIVDVDMDEDVALVDSEALARKICDLLNGEKG